MSAKVHTPGASSSSLKRPRDSPMSQIPPFLPPLQAELLLEVFTHRSVKFEGAPGNDEFGDNDRLSSLGKRVLAMVVAKVLFDQRPMLKATDLEVKIDEALSPDSIDRWVEMYQLRNKIRCLPDARERLKEPQETELLFNSYVGAVSLQHGLSAVLSWIGKLVDPSFESSSDDEDGAGKRFKSEFATSPPPPADIPPPLPMPVNPLSPAQPSAAFLPLFNQTAMQRRVTVDWNTNSTGPSHAPAWTAQCIVSGIAKGTGTGKSKQLAKEDAARQAFYNMGWAGQP